VSDSEPGKLGSRLFDACVAVLLAAMALWGAVQIIASIWLALCVGLAVVGVLGLSLWIIFSRFRRW